MKAIPKKLLPNTVTYKKYLGDTGEGTSFDTVVSLLNVKVDDVKKVIVTKDNTELVGNALMFYDCINSTGLTTIPTENSIITFNTHEYRIIDVETLYIKSTPHHYEILLK
jgi:hypothetical protein